MTYSILIVDDEPNLRLTLAQILSDAGYGVTAAADAAQALGALAAGSFDLVFLDLRMPDVDGMTLFREIRRLYPEIVVLILTGHATLESATEAVRLGARDYIYKPVDPEHILVRIREILAGERQPQRRREIMDQIRGLLTELNQVEGATEAAATAVPSSARHLQRGLLSIDVQARMATLGKRQVPISGSAFDYLVTLVRHAPDPVPFQDLVRESQGYEVSRAEAQDMARWWVHQLRKALEPKPDEPQYIVTVRGTGYRLAM